MAKIALNLPHRRRLDVRIVKRRGVDMGKPLFPNVREIKNARSGHKLSRFFRHVFEHKNIKKLLGSNLALAVLASTVIPSNPYSEDFTAGESPIVNTESLSLKTEKSLKYPLEGIVINQGYLPYHPGIDFEGVKGDPVYPIMPGVVKSVQYSKYGYGNAILIKHSEEFSSLYAHLSKINVTKEQKVLSGEIVGEVGSTGRSSGDHLHLEIRKNGYPVNPLSILPQR